MLGYLQAIEVTFRVNMSEVTPSSSGVHVAGLFQGWNPTASPMTAVGDGIYELTFDLEPGQTSEYKFINGSGWNAPSVVENLTAAGCGIGPDGNRIFTIPEDATDGYELPTVCFNSCVNCGTSVELTQVTFRVNMQDVAVSSNGVHVAGAFQGWNPSGSEMTDEDEDGIYEFTTEIAPGAQFQYKFINGNDWIAPNIVENVGAPCGVAPDGNRTLTVPEEDLILPAVCFNTCAECIEIGEPILVTFKVNLENIEISPAGPHIAGSFNNFTPEIMVLESESIYAFSALIPVGTTVNYKFLNGATFNNQEIVPAACGTPDGFGGFNRSYTVVEADFIDLDPVCFSECEDCTEPAPQILVTFFVDMSTVAVSDLGVHIAGSFNNFTPTLMDIAGGNNYSFSTLLEVGSTHTYKFLNGATFENQEVVPADCGTDDGFGGLNRSVTIPEEFFFDLDLVCFSACGACPEPVEVTFFVEMGAVETINPEGVHIAGNFNDFTPQLMSVDNNEIYTFTTTAFPGETLVYKFLNGPSFELQEAVPAECGQPDGFGGFNRFLLVGDENETLETTCFNECTGGCTVSIFENSNNNSLGIYPNPSKGTFTVSSKNFSNTQSNILYVYDLSGRLIIEKSMNNATEVIEIKGLSNGIYQVVLTNNNGQSTSKLVIE